MNCDTCKFKYYVIYEEPEYFCEFHFKHCKLNYFEKKKLKRFEKRLENIYKTWCEKNNNPLAKEALLKTWKDIRYKRKEYLETLMNKGKISYEEES